MQKQFKYLSVKKQNFHGFQKANISCQRNAGNTTLFGPDDSYKKNNKNRKYGVCQYNHGIWQFSTFKGEDVNCGYEFVKKLKLCFRCLGSDHLSKSCNSSRICETGDVQTCTIVFYIKRNMKKQKNKTLKSLTRNTSGSQSKICISLYSKKSMVKEQNQLCIFPNCSYYLKKRMSTNGR